MVFESVVADLLNRFLGDYVENLDRSQLKIGIWGGDVVLENLVLKQNALDDLDLPVQTIFGHLGKLILKIPWKNLYGASVEASIEGLYLLVSPNRDVKYDAEKEDRICLQNKQNELQRVEEAKKREAQKDQQKVDDSFVEKLVTQIIKNVQLNIKDIHIRYEDKITNVNAPFSFGISLHNLSVNTTDDRWRRTVVQDAVTKIFKVLDLEGLALYWNPNSMLYSSLTRAEILSRFEKEIATKSFQPEFFKYILGPITASAKLKLNPKPEQDTPKFEVPKVILNLDMEQLAIGMTKAQYQDIMKLADSMDRMAKGTPFRQYRPNLSSFRGHYKEWWQFAYTCIMESEVKRKQKNWDWNNICKHRNMCRQYATAYQCKLQTPKKISRDIQCTLDDCEKILDLFNLVVIRQRIEMEVARLGKAQEEAKKNKGWFSSWWGGDKSKDEESADGTDIMRQFEKAMTSEEKLKLFQAIDYQENSSPTHFPVEFIATECHFILGSLVLSITDDHTNVLTSKLNHVEASLQQRPSANAIRVVVRMQEFTVSGLNQNGLIPLLVTSKEITPGVSLLDVVFETNPLDGECGQRIKVAARPLELVYDAQTIIKIVDVFKPPSESSALSQLQAAAESKFSNLKEKSALGLQYAVSRHTVVDIDIDFCSSYLILPHSGIYTKNEPCIVINLGAVSIKSAPRSMKVLDVHQLFKDGANDEEIMKQALLYSYDKFILNLTDMQVVIANKGEDWKSCIAKSDGTSLHLLHPTTLTIEIDKCLITDDYRLPKIKASGRLMKIAVNVSEDRLITMLEILVSVPFPKDDQAPLPLKASESRSSSLSLLKYFDPAENKKRHTDKKVKQWEADDFVQLTEIEANFTMDEFILMIFRKSNVYNIDCPIEKSEKLASFALNGLEIQAVQKTLMLNASIKLLDVSLSLYQSSVSEPLKLIYTPRCNDSDQYLFSIKYCNVDKKCPDFHGKHGSVEQLIELDFRILQVLLHQEGIQELLTVSSQYQARLLAVQGEKDRVGSAGTPLSIIPEDEEVPAVRTSKDASGSGKRKKKNQIETIGLKVKILIEKVGVEFANKKRSLAKVAVSGFKADLSMKESYIQISAKLQDIKVIDQNQESIHTQILAVVDGDAFNAELVIYNTDQYPNDEDISITAHISCMRIIFLNWFVSSMLNFLNNFQAAQQAIKDASAMAAESAKANVQNAYEKATKVAMFIQLNAPIVIVPENSKSPYAVMVDFGQIRLKNKFLSIKADDNKEVIIDELTMALENLKLSRVKLTPYEENINNEKMLLQPTTFNLIVKRNLSSWYDKLPDIDMSGRLNAIIVTLSSDDMKMAMKVLSENLTEGSQETIPNTSASTRPQLKASVSIDSRSSGLKKSDTLMHAMKQKEPSDKPPKTLIKFTFTMDSLTIEMMNKVVDNNETLSPLSSSEEVGLARFSLLLLSMKGKMLSNNSLQTSILLVNCLLDDMRPNRKSKLTRFMQRKQDNGSVSNISNLSSDSPEKLRSMIDITYTQKGDDIFLGVRIFSFNLILSMDFMMKISDFVTNGLAIANNDEMADSSKQAGETELVPILKTSDSKMYSRKVSKISQDQPVRKDVSKSQTAEKSKGMITINLKVEKPDILLVESMDDKNCRALVLNNELEFKMRMTEEQKKMEGTIKELQLFTCTYSKLGKQDINRHSVLVPCSLSLNASSSGNSGWNVDIAMTDIILNVSPATIELLNRVMVTMTKSDEDVEEKNDIVGVYNDLWDIKPFQPQSYWFLKTEIGQEALEDYSELNQNNAEQEIMVSGEICNLSAPVIVLCIEAGLGNNTIPMLSMKSSLQATIKDWSGQLNVESSWAMQISYYNNFLALWEPLVEPVEVMEDNQYKHIPWELRMEVQMNKKNQNQTEFSNTLSPTSDVPQSFDDVDGEIGMPQPSLSVQITSTETLEMTITNTALQVLTQLGNAFSNAVHGELQSKSSDVLSPYLVKNETGLTIILLLENDPFIVYERIDNDSSLLGINTTSTYKDVVLESGASVPLQLKPGLTAVTGLNEKLPDWKLHIKVAELDSELYLPIVRADKRYFPVKKFPSVVNDNFGIISDVAMIDGAIHINIRSIIQVLNNLSVPVEVYFMTETGKDVESLGLVEPKGTMNLPLKAVYTSTSELFFGVNGYQVSSSAFIWKDLQKNLKLTKLIHCVSRNKNMKDQFFMKAVGIMEQVFFADTSRHTMPSTCYNIYLRPAVVLQNSLPVNIIVSPQGIQKPIEHTVKPGETLHLPQVQPGNTVVVIMLPSYLEKCWVCTKEIPENGSEFSVWTFDSHDSVLKMSLELGMHCTELNGSQHFSLYCPFWMLNKTGLPLAYKSSEDSSNVLYHPADFIEPILFSFKAKSFFGKKKASIRIENGEWSDKFSLDVPGSSGVVLCNTDGKSYQVGVSNILTYNGLTKQVIFTPYFLLINNAPFSIECQEMDRPGDPYIKVEAKSTTPFWPKSVKGNKLMRLRASSHPAISAPFLYTDQHTSLLKLNNQFGGINVETLITEGCVYVTFRQYRPGLAPALIINHTIYSISLWEKESVNIKNIVGMSHMMYTWENPAGPRIILFEGHKKKEIENDLRKDGIGEFTIGETRIYWVSFLDGMQRVLLFTTDILLANGAHNAGESGVIDTEVTISLHGIGLSLVNNLVRQEILYMSIASSGIIWEQSKFKTNRYKSLNIKDAAIIEDAYQRYLAQASDSATSSRVNVDNKIEIDFFEMEMYKPQKRRLRRIMQPGLWAQWGSGTHRSQLHARLHRLQIDQQLPTPTFPVVLAPVPPPKSVAASHGIKPFVELCIVERIMEHTNVKQYKYFKILVQEFHIKIDMDLINALMNMFPEEEINESVGIERFALDLEVAGRPLESVVAAGAASDVKHFYDELHLSPLKVHVSFSLAGATQLPTFIGTLLQGLGVTLTDMNDVIFKLAYYERVYEFLSQKEMISSATNHYTGQALKQLYVLVLGLDVIGNPYGLVIGLTKGVEDLFYEPFQGAIQGPGEFAEGLMLGVRSLFGHTVGGAAGAVSRITGAMGHGLAALSLDEEYQRKRRDNINKPPANIQEGIARSGKGLLMGVVDGVTGVFTKPISGARDEGVGGFFKGLGKGAVGLIARPTAGVVDFASGSLDAVKRAADTSSEIVRHRPARWLETDGLVRPYSRKSAEGFKILRDLDKGKYISTDIYETHLWIVAMKEIVLCTDKRIAYLEKNTVFGGWQILWSYTWQEMPSVPMVVEKGVFIPVAHGRKKLLSVNPSSGKLILIHDDKQRVFLTKVCERLMGNVC